ncbi:hypothetical protein [Streptomyces sp. SID3343]|uniref:hypothetical protein n=1 Tax=Streptomyces sp. SID3343 TaxID=2690260 RepID=UPI0013701D30|nr:hypothetical protein [Streptomyces sp. SID3343]MYW03855.1 hypothetical protein [Streptomyces sp. SID3343]
MKFFAGLDFDPDQSEEIIEFVSDGVLFDLHNTAVLVDVSLDGSDVLAFRFDMLDEYVNPKAIGAAPVITFTGVRMLSIVQDDDFTPLEGWSFHGLEWSLSSDTARFDLQLGGFEVGFTATGATFTRG